MEFYQADLDLLFSKRFPTPIYLRLYTASGGLTGLSITGPMWRHSEKMQGSPKRVCSRAFADACDPCTRFSRKRIEDFPLSRQAFWDQKRHGITSVLRKLAEPTVSQFLVETMS
jgi:hypothetical protein